jgi:hypothetical protein
MNRTFETPCGAFEPDFSRFYGPVSGFGLPLGNLRADFALHRVQSPAKDRRHSRQVVSSQGKSGLGFHLGQSNKTGFAQTTDRLRPTEYLFNPFAQLQAHAVTGMPGRSPINRALHFSRNVRRHAVLTHRLDETRRIVILVSTQGGAPLQRACGHHGSRFTLRRTGGQGRFHIDRQSVPVLHQGMAQITETGLVSPLDFLSRRASGSVVKAWVTGCRAARNQLIKDVMRDYRYLEHSGMGVPRKIVKCMREHNGTEPELIEEGELFTIRLFKGKMLSESGSGE